MAAADEDSEEFYFRRLVGLRVVDGMMTVGVEWYGDWGADQITYERLDFVPVDALFELLRRYDPLLFTREELEAFDRAGLDLDEVYH